VDNKRVFQFSLYDNPFLDPDYIHSLETEYTGVWKKRYIEGLWVAGSGAIYDCFGEANIIADSKQYLSRCQRVWAGCDYGTVNPLAFGLFGLDYDGQTIYQFAEYYYDSKQTGIQKSDDDYVVAIQEFLEGLGMQASTLDGMYVDPSAASFILALRQADAPVIPAHNAVLEGIQHVYTLLSKKQLLIDVGCVNTIKQLYSYSWDTRASNRGKEQPLKSDDHAVDCLRYALWSTKIRESDYTGLEGIVTRPRTRRG
jgi:PBSX family phage terminase large subunit